MPIGVLWTEAYYTANRINETLISHATLIHASIADATGGGTERLLIRAIRRLRDGR